MDLDKKIQKVQPDLVQSVLEAYEKRNHDRVEVLISNAIKQLKMSRFKPDQTTCISLIYLARTCPKLFSQSSNIKEQLKSHIKRENGPSNIKGTKTNDITLPVLAANILLACCDFNDVKTIILTRIEQLLSSTNQQKPPELILQLIAALCIRSRGDEQTISSLIDIRHHWLQYLDENFQVYGKAPIELCIGIRKLLHNESKCESLIENLNFLSKHDQDIFGLSRKISEFIVERPISIECMLNDKQYGNQLKQLILNVYNKLYERLRKSPKDSIEAFRYNTSQSIDENQQQPEPMDVTITPDKPNTINEHKTVIVKMETMETNDDGFKKEPVKPEPIDAQPAKSDSTETSSTTNINQPRANDTYDSDRGNAQYKPPLYMKLASVNEVVAFDRTTIEAILSLLATIELDDKLKSEFKILLDCWLLDNEVSSKPLIYEDICMTTPYHFSSKMRQKLIHSGNDALTELGLHCADTSQLLNLLQQFGLPLGTLNKILKKLNEIKDTDSIKTELKDVLYFNEMMEFYADMGATSAHDLTDRLASTV